MTDELAAAVTCFERARRVLFITGAGISADSGLPTYRGVSGLYEGNSTEDGYCIEDALSASMFADDPACTWKYIRQIEASCRGAVPNIAHFALAACESRFEHVCVLTQNVDGLHRVAGSTNLIEIHGNVHELRCTACRWQLCVTDYASVHDDVPRCPECAAVVRPKVVLFDEMLAGTELMRYEAELAAGFDLVVVIGTTAVFPYIMRPIIEAARMGRATLEINPATTLVSEFVDVRLTMGAAKAMSAIALRLNLAVQGVRSK